MPTVREDITDAVAESKKVTKEAANYGPGTKAEHCGICEYFEQVKPSHCTKVKGAIEPTAVREVVGAAESRNTRRAYWTQIAKFEAWCKRRGTNPLPTTPAVVAVFLVDLAQTGANPDNPKGAKVATIGLALSAISAAHRAAGFELDTRPARSARR
jgi:hypothetical protein